MHYQGFLAAMGPNQTYSLEDSMASFFSTYGVERNICDAKSIELVGGSAIPVSIQGNCSYSVYAGPSSEFVVQYRPESLPVDIEIIRRARDIHGLKVPLMEEQGRLDASGKKGALIIYVMPRVQGMSYLEFVRKQGISGSPSILRWRSTFIKDAARYAIRTLI